MTEPCGSAMEQVRRCQSVHTSQASESVLAPMVSVLASRPAAAATCFVVVVRKGASVCRWRPTASDLVAYSDERFRAVERLLKRPQFKQTSRHGQRRTGRHL